MDHAATTSTHPEVIRAMQPYFHDKFANPSGIYSIAKENRQKIEKCRQMIADTLHAKKNEIYFTAGGSEGDNWALKEIADTYSKKGRHIITTKLEHHGILHTCEYLERHEFEVTYLDVDIYGRENPVQVERAIRKDTILISVMFANNEIGTIQPIGEIGAIARRHNVLFHTDAVQAYGQIPIDVACLQVDLLTASGHKFRGPKGTGFLYVREGVRLQSLIHGGAQEQGLRAGTENVPGIVGLATAAYIADAAMEQRMQYEIQIREYMIGAYNDSVQPVKWTPGAKTSKQYQCVLSVCGWWGIAGYAGYTRHLCLWWIGMHICVERTVPCVKGNRAFRRTGAWHDSADDWGRDNKKGCRLCDCLHPGTRPGTAGTVTFL